MIQKQWASVVSRMRRGAPESGPTASTRALLGGQAADHSTHSRPPAPVIQPWPVIQHQATRRRPMSTVRTAASARTGPGDQDRADVEGRETNQTKKNKKIRRLGAASSSLGPPRRSRPRAPVASGSGLGDQAERMYMYLDCSAGGPGGPLSACVFPRETGWNGALCRSGHGGARPTGYLGNVRTGSALPLFFSVSASTSSICYPALARRRGAEGKGGGRGLQPITHGLMPPDTERSCR